MRLLIAEDCSISREIVRRILRDQDHHLTFVADGGEAWETLRRAPGDFDAVMLDLVMPRLGGFEVLARMRSAEELRSKPVVLCTALGDRLSVAHAARLAVEHYIVKPYARALLLAKLELVAEALEGADSGRSQCRICASLGIDAETYRELADRLAEDLRVWAEQAQQVACDAALHALLLRTDALRGAALALGAMELSRELDRASRRLEEMHHERELLPCELLASELGGAVHPVMEALARWARSGRSGPVAKGPTGRGWAPGLGGKPSA